jgi:hypothetical protein
VETQKKSQSAVEFIIIVGFIMFFFGVFLLLLSQQFGEKSKEDDNQDLTFAINNVQDEIMLAAKSSEGYSRNFVIPDNINGKDCNLTLSDGMIYGYIINGKSSMAIPTINVTGNIRVGNNIIEKQGGVIYLNKP